MYPNSNHIKGRGGCSIQELVRFACLQPVCSLSGQLAACDCQNKRHMRQMAAPQGPATCRVATVTSKMKRPRRNCDSWTTPRTHQGWGEGRTRLAERVTTHKCGAQQNGLEILPLSAPNFVSPQFGVLCCHKQRLKSKMATTGRKDAIFDDRRRQPPTPLC